MAVCPSCKSTQPDGTVYCDNCGAQMNVPQAVLSATVAMPSTPTGVTATCPQCGSPVTPGTSFCENCGAALAPGGMPAPVPQSAAQQPAPATPPLTDATCKNCGAQLQPGSAFCDMCGAPVGTSAPSTPSVQPQYQQPMMQPQYQQPPMAQQPVQPPFQPVGDPDAYQQSGGRFVVQMTNAQLPFPPDKTEFVVGREDAASSVFPEIDLNDHGGDEGGVSRNHARVLIRDEQFFIEDLGSVNSTFVNRQKLTPKQPHPLNNGDEVQFGRVKVNFYL